MVKTINLNVLIILFFLALFQTAFADNDSSNQEFFPFDKPCLTFDKANFKVGPALLDVMKGNDFPQYCVLYSLSNYQVKQKIEDGYFIAGSGAEASNVFLKTGNSYKMNQMLASNGSDVSKPVGQWAYFVGPEEFSQGNGPEKEMYVFQEIDFTLPSQDNSVANSGFNVKVSGDLTAGVVNRNKF